METFDLEKKIERAIQEAEEGRAVKIQTTEDLHKFLETL